MTRILLLDDDDLVATSLQRALQREGYQVQVASTAAQALEAARLHVFDLLICDVRLPEVDGLDALHMLRDMQAGVRSIVITGYASQDAPVRAIKNHVDDYLFKPFSVDDLLRSVRYSVALCQAEREASEALESLRRRYLHMVATLVAAFQDQDPMFYHHSRRVAALAVDIGRELTLGSRALDQLELAALLHDVGLSYIDREILRKADALAEEEARKLRQHPMAARDLLALAPDLHDVLPILLHQRERFDGSGYPDGLQGADIPMESRILSVAEAYDSLTHDRPHRAAHSVEEALAELRRCSPSQFDPAVVEVCASLAAEARALTDLSGLLQRSEGSEDLRRRFATLMRLANLFRDSGNGAAATATYQAAAEALSHDSQDVEQFWLQAEQAMLAIREGRKAEAVEQAQRLARQAESIADGSDRARVLSLLAALYMEACEVDRAQQLLAKVVDLHRQEGDLLATAAARATLVASYCQPDRDLRQFATALQEWLDSAPPAFFENLAGPEARTVVSTLNWARQREVDLARVSSLLAQLAAGEERAAPPTAATLEVRLFGPLTVRIADETLPAAAWSTRKARELFAFLVVQGRAVSADRLVEVLWPDALDTGRQNLHKTVSRVRQALRSLAAAVGLSVVTSERNFYGIDPTLSCWCDVRQYEGISSAAWLQSDGPLAEADLIACQRALSLYRGDFMEGGGGEPWIEIARTTWREKWFAMLARLARHHAAARQWERCLQCWQRMLEVETCREEAWLGIMRCHHAQGQREAVIKAWRDYRGILDKELGLEPSTAASELYAQLMDGAYA